MNAIRGLGEEVDESTIVQKVLRYLPMRGLGEEVDESIIVKKVL